jgi:hypothetical protein
LVELRGRIGRALMARKSRCAVKEGRSTERLIVEVGQWHSTIEVFKAALKKVNNQERVWRWCSGISNVLEIEVVYNLICLVTWLGFWRLWKCATFPL